VIQPDHENARSDPKNTERPLQDRADFLAVDFVEAARLLGGQSFSFPSAGPRKIRA
jgi:hypothetical protein